MNRLTKPSSRRGSGGHATRSPSVRGPVTSAPAEGTSATQGLAAGSAATARVAVPVRTPPVSVSPFGGWCPTSSPSEGTGSSLADHAVQYKVLRGEQKWSAYLARQKKEKEKSAKANPAQLMNLELDGEHRPIGHKKAKKELTGKKKSSEVLADFNGKFEKFIEATTKSKEDREKMAEIQLRLADKNIEVARLNKEAAHEQTKCKMLETYTQLLLAPKDQLSEDGLAERNLAIESLRLALFPK